MDTSNEKFIDTINDTIIYKAICCYDSDGKLIWKDVDRNTCEIIKNEIEEILGKDIASVQKMRPADVFRKLNVKINHLFILFDKRFSNNAYDYIPDYKKIHFGIHVFNHEYLQLNKEITKEKICEINEKVHGNRYSYLLDQLSEFNSYEYGDGLITLSWFID